MKRGLLKVVLLAFFCLFSNLAISQEYKSKVDPYLKLLYKNKVYNNSSSARMRQQQTNDLLGIPAINETVDLQKNDPDVSVIIEYTGQESLLLNTGVKVNSHIGNFYTVNLPISKLPLLSKIQGMKEIEMGKPIANCSDVSMATIRAAEARVAFGYTGAGVVIGIIDTGIDFKHADFKASSGNTRIQFIWDQDQDLGIKPVGFNYGSEFNAGQINLGNVFSTDLDGHGTHVAGIAAGSGYATGNGVPAGKYTGVAPSADLVVVRLAERSLNSSSANLIDGILYIANKARQLNQPWCINMSYIPTTGPRNGTSLFERTVSEIAGNSSLGKGRVIVSAAGNDGYDPKSGSPRLHAEDIWPAEKSFNVKSTTTSKQDNVAIEIYYPKWSGYKVQIISPSGKTYGPVDPTIGFLSQNTSEGHVFLSSFEEDFLSGGTDEVALININDLDSTNDGIVDFNLAPGKWKIKMIEGSGDWDAYIVSIFKTKEQKAIGDFDENSYSNTRLISEPGNIENVICVGSVTSKATFTNILGKILGYNYLAPVGSVSYFSSPGPSRSGLIKPDILAPGQFIASSKSSTVGPSKWWCAPLDGANITTPDGKHVYMGGTSMAAPHVTGAVALILQKHIVDNGNNSFWVGDVKRILNKSKNNGILDVYEALNDGPVTGLEDKVVFNTCGVNSNPSIIETGKDNTFCARFIDENPTGDYALSYKWFIELFHSEGTTKINAQTKSGGTTSTYLTNINASLLPNHNWSRDANGNIKGRVLVECLDNDSVKHQDVWDIGVKYKPNPPLIIEVENTLTAATISFLSSGVITYKIHYGTKQGGPYNGTEATQGSSPITVSDVYKYTLTGLNIEEQTYYFVIEAINSYGSTSSAEFQTNPTIATKEPLSTLFCNNDILSIPFKATGFKNNTTFQAWLSDSFGTFDTHTVIGSLVGKSAGTINARIYNASPSTKYRVKVVSVFPVVEGYKNIQDLTIKPFLSISVDLYTNNPFCAGQEGVINFTTSCSFTYTNTFKAQLSDANGNFNNPIDIGIKTVTNTDKGQLFFKMPTSNIVSGTSYKIRVICSEAGVISPSTLPFTINVPATVNALPVSVSACLQASVKITLSATGNIQYYAWEINKGNYIVNANQDIGFGEPYSGALTSELTITEVRDYMSNYKYRCIIGTPGCVIRSEWVSLNIISYINLPIISTPICFNKTTSIPFTTNACQAFQSDNIFTAQLSDAYGNFNSPINIGTLSGASSGSILVTLPSIPNGSGYKVRISSSKPVRVSNSTEISIIRSITTGNPSHDALCSGSNLSVPYTVNSCTVFQPGNIFKATLSDASGNFSNPIIIGQLNGTESGIINAIVPANLPDGSGYKIRVTSSSPASTGDTNPLALKVNQSTSILISTQNKGATCGDEVLSFSSSIINGGANPTYQWVLNEVIINGQVASVYSSNSLNNGDRIKCILYSNSECGSNIPVSSNVITIYKGHQLPVILEQPQSVTICQQPANITFSINAVGSNLTYQWQKLVSGNYTDLSRWPEMYNDTEKTATLKISPQAYGTTYRCKVTASCITGYGKLIYSNPVNVTISCTSSSSKMISSTVIYQENSEDQKGLNQINIFPNPTNGNFTIEVAQSLEKGMLFINDVNGKKWGEVKLSSKIQNIDIVGLAPGLYIINVLKGNSSVKKKLLVQ